jgi:outer membrane protein assembly factor BamD
VKSISVLAGLFFFLFSFGVCTLGGCAKAERPVTADEYLRQADALLKQRREQRAREYYQELLEKFPDSDYRALAQLRIADTLYEEKNYLEARFEYQKFLDLYPAHPFASQAQFQIAMCSMQEVSHYDRDQQQTQEALRAFRQLRRTYPQDPLVPQAEEHIRTLRQHLATHEMSIARFYYKKGANQAAINRLLNLIQSYPETQDLDAALYMLGECYLAEENFVKAQRVFRTLVDRFPASQYVSQARAQLRELPSTGITLQ